MVRQLESVSSGGRRAVMEQYARQTGKSTSQLYRLARRYGWRVKRKKRQDADATTLTPEQVLFIAGLINETKREVKGPIMPVERALEIAIANNYIQEGQVSAGYMRQILSKKQVSAKFLKQDGAHIEMRSEHPNHVHVYDVSVCIQYYLDNKKMRVASELDYYKNKPEHFKRIKTRLLRYVVVDHFSGAFYFRYFNTTGETQDNLYNFLIEAWAGCGYDEKYPFCGVPFKLLMDRGAANTAHGVVNFMRRLGVDVIDGLPYQKTRQGAVEVLHNIIERWFESGLKLEPTHDLEELNRWAYDFCVKFNAKHIHSRHGMTRTESWLLIKPEQLRKLPESAILKELFSKDAITARVTKQLKIQYNSMQYSVRHVEQIYPGATVEVKLKPFLHPKIDVLFADKTYELSPIEKLSAEEGGFSVDAAVIGREFKSKPETLTQKAVKTIENMAYGEGKKKDAVPFAGLKVFGYQAEEVDVAFLPKRSTHLEYDKTAVSEAKYIPIYEFFKRLVNEIGQIPPELNKELRAKYGEAIEVKAAEEEMLRICQPSYQWKEAACQ